MGADDALIVPVIDISPFVAAAAASSTIDAKEDLQEQCNETAKEWDQAMSTVGFALIVGHGVDPSTIENLRKGLRSFFEDQSIDYKSGFLYGPYGGPKGGYTAVGGEAVSRSQDGHGGTEEDAEAMADPVESYICRHKDNDPFASPSSPTPPQPPEFENAAAEYYSEMRRVLDCLHRMSENALGLPHEYLEPFYTPHPNGHVVAKYYPAVPNPKNPLRYGAHTDYIGYTILKQDDLDGEPSAAGGGLQVWLKGTNEWKPVVPRQDAFAVNLGDLYEDWTNGRWTSAVHRVVAPTPGSEAAQTPRLSIPFFAGPDDDAMIETFPTCLPTNGEMPRLTSPIRSGDHLMRKLQATQV